MMRPPAPPNDATSLLSAASPATNTSGRKSNQQHQLSDELCPTSSSHTIQSLGTNNTNVIKRVLIIELTSIRNNGSKDAVEVGQIRKVESGDGSIRLIATMQSKLVDDEQANLTAAMMFEQIDQIVSTNVTCSVERVRITALRFTPEAIVGIKGFLSMFLKTIKHVSMKDILPDNYKAEEEQSFIELCQIFQTCKLETLNLSDNMIPALTWKCWSSQVYLRQLILDYVGADDDSLCELAKNFVFGETLDELYVVLTQRIGPTGIIAANSILRCCRCVGSLRWAVKDAPPDTLMPWRGLAEMAQEMMKSRSTTTLLHLVMDGGTISEEDCGLMGLAGALENFTELQSIKLRSIGLKDIGASHLSSGLHTAMPPLQILDLSRNFIQSTGASAIASLCEVDSITSNLTSLSLERNTIDIDGALSVLEAFGMKGNPKLDMKLDGNPFSFNKVAYTLACRKSKIELDQPESSTHTMQSTENLELEIKMLQYEVKKLHEEKLVLMQAFSVMGRTNRVVECTRLIDRVTALEKHSFGQVQDFSNHSMYDMDTSMGHNTITETSQGRQTILDTSTGRASALEQSSSLPVPPITPSNSGRVMVNTQQPIVNHINPLRSPMPSYNHNNRYKTSSINNVSSGTPGNDYWMASPVGSHTSNTNQKKKLTITGSFSETPNIYQSSPGLNNGFAKPIFNVNNNNGGAGTRNGGGSISNFQYDYDDMSKTSQSRAGSSTMSNGQRTYTSSAERR